MNPIEKQQEALAEDLFPAPRQGIDRQLSGYWLDRDRPTPLRPAFEHTGAVLPRQDELDLIDFMCLDLVRIDAGPTFVWLPLSEAGRYTYAHSLGLIYGEPWRLVVYDRGGSVHEYDAAYAEALPPDQVGYYYGREAEMRARQDYPTVQLHLRRRETSDPRVLAAFGHDGHYLGTYSPGESPAPGSIVCPSCQHASTRADERHVCNEGWSAEARGNRVERVTGS